jgi:hypothetical protein
VLDTGADLLVGRVVGLFPVGQFFAFAAAVRHDKPCARIATVGDRRRRSDGGLRAGLLPRLAVIAVTGKGPADHHDESGIGVDDDLVVRGVPVVLGLLSDGVVAGGHQGAVDDEHGVLAEPSARPQGKRGTEVVDDPVGRGLRDAEERRELAHRQICAPVGRHEQYPVFQRKGPRPALADWIRTFAAQRGHQLLEGTRAQPAERGYPRRLRRRDHTSHHKIVP